jgi:hypothetical protein
MSADRFKQAAKANDSGSWNKYSYTRGDPVNRADHRGLADWSITVTPDDGDCNPTTKVGCPEDGGGGGGFGGGPTGTPINPYTLNGFTGALSQALGALATPIVRNPRTFYPGWGYYVPGLD